MVDVLPVDISMGVLKCELNHINFVHCLAKKCDFTLKSYVIKWKMKTGTKLKYQVDTIRVLKDGVTRT